MRKHLNNFVIFYLGIGMICLLKNDLLYFFIISFLLYLLIKKKIAYYFLGFLMYSFLLDYHLLLRSLLFLNIYLLLKQIINKYKYENLFVFWLATIIYFFVINILEKLIFNFRDIVYITIFSLNIIIINLFFLKKLARDTLFR